MPELLSRLQNALSDRYRLDSEIGAGGMATVCLAQIDVSPDGSRLVMVRPLTGVAETELVLVQNWFEELRARVGK